MQIKTQNSYQNSWGPDYMHHEEIMATDPDVDEMFDTELLAQGHARWCTGGMVRWSTGQQALFGDLTDQELHEEVAPQLTKELESGFSGDLAGGGRALDGTPDSVGGDKGVPSIGGGELK